MDANLTFMQNNIHFHLKFTLPNGHKFGPGKAELLSYIDQYGSISAAARAMGMGYAKASKMARDMNKMCASPLIKTYQGGQDKGGATLTQKGTDILSTYQKWVYECKAESHKLMTQFENSNPSKEINK